MGELYYRVLRSYKRTRELEKAVKEMKDKQSTGDDDVSGDVLKLLGEDVLKVMSQLSATYMKVEGGPRISLELQ